MSRKMRPMIGVLVLLVAAALPTALAQEDAARDDDAETQARPDTIMIDAVARSPTELDLTVEQLWLGDNAESLRQSFDAFFGAADGTLTDEELDRIAAATAIELQDEELPWLAIADERYVVEDAEVRFVGAEGQVDNAQPLTIIHELSLEADVPAEDLEEEALEWRLAPLADGELTFAPPEDWHVADAEGLDDATLTDEGVVEGEFARNEEVVLTLAPGAAPEQQAAEGEGAEEAVEGDGRDTPALGLAAVLAVVVAVGGALALSRRRGSNR